MKPKQSEYNQTINLTSHLILTQPKAIVALLAGYGIQFEDRPSREQLINEVVELMKDSTKFTSDLGELLALHVQENGREMMRLEGENFNYQDEQEDAFLGGLIKGAAKLVGGLFKGKRRNRGDGGAARAAMAQAAAAKKDMAMQMARMQAEARARAAEERRRREQERLDRERREKEAKQRQEAAKKKQTQMMAVVIGVVALGAVGLLVAKSSGSKSPYYPPMPIQPVQPQMPLR